MRYEDRNDENLFFQEVIFLDTLQNNFIFSYTTTDRVEKGIPPALLTEFSELNGLSEETFSSHTAMTERRESDTEG